MRCGTQLMLLTLITSGSLITAAPVPVPDPNPDLWGKVKAHVTRGSEAKNEAMHESNRQSHLRSRSPRLRRGLPLAHPAAKGALAFSTGATIYTAHDATQKWKAVIAENKKEKAIAAGMPHPNTTPGAGGAPPPGGGTANLPTGEQLGHHAAALLAAQDPPPRAGGTSTGVQPNSGANSGKALHRNKRPAGPGY